MTLTIKTKTKTYHCEYADIEANENDEVVVTMFGDFPAAEQMTFDEIGAIISDPFFCELLRLASENAMPGTPIFRAFHQMKRPTDDLNVVLRFQQPDFEVAA